MPRVTIRRQRKVFSRKKARRLAKAMPAIIAAALGVKPHEVEVLIQKFGRDDLNIAPVGIDIDTGMGKEDFRLKERKALALRIAEQVCASGVVPAKYIGKPRSYAWLMVVGSAFVPLGHPNLAR